MIHLLGYVCTCMNINQKGNDYISYIEIKTSL